MSNIINTVLLQQYRVDAFVASGGMGAVYRVWDLKRNAHLAMKVLHSDLADDPSVFKRFKREANALKRLTHPNIVPFYGLYETLDFAFLLEHYVDGPSLKDVLRRHKGKALSIEEALIYLKVLSAALGYAHANGVVHCDVKPGNVMIDHGGRIYLTDFGIARHAESTTTTLGVAGTPAYMAPEQLRGEPVTPATDVYALGVMLFEMLTGQRPFRGTEAGTEKGGATANERIRYGHLHLQPPNPYSLNGSIPSNVSNVILKALSKQPAQRYNSALGFFEAACLAAGVQNRGVASQATLTNMLLAKPETNGTKNVAMVKTALAGRKKTSSPWRTIGCLIALLGSLVMLAIVGIVAGIWFVGRMGLENLIPLQMPIPTQTHFTTQVPPKPTDLPPTQKPPAPTNVPPTQKPPTPRVQQFFTEEFDNPLSGDWSVFTITDPSVSNLGRVTVEAESGNLAWNLDSEYVYYYLFYNAFTYEDVKVEARADNRGKNNNSVSLICRYDEEIGWYEFNIANNGLYDILYAEVLDSGKIRWNRVANGGSNAINQGTKTNEYSITCQGDELTLNINGDKTISLQETKYGLHSGLVGISVSSFDVLPILIEMDWVKISRP
jgi:hypothetical protein